MAHGPRVGETKEADCMYLIDMVLYWAKSDPHRQALIQPELITTYKALAEAIESAANRIEQLGLDRREPIGIAIANPSFFIAAVLAGLRCGYSVALVRTALFPLLQSAGIRNLIYDFQGLMVSGGRNIRFDPSWVTSAKATKSAPLWGAPPAKDAALIFFTSGTTGVPKTVAQSVTALDELLKYPLTCASGEGGRILIMPGLSTTLGFNRLCEVLNAGKSAYFAPDSESALSLISLHGIDVAVTSATQAIALARLRNSNPGYQVGSLKTLFIGGGKLSPDAIATIRSAICRNVINQYGSTEAGVAALTPFHVLDDQPGVVPLPWIDLEVVDEGGQPLPAETEGHIRYRTPQLAENLKAPGAQNVPGIRDGWFYPGDIGSITAGGILRFAGRSSDVLNRGGIKVSGTRIEEILLALPQVKDAAACGVLGASGLEEIWIAVVPNTALGVQEIKDVLRNHSDVSIEPDEVFILDELPVGELGKVQKARLKEILLSRKRTS